MTHPGHTDCRRAGALTKRILFSRLFSLYELFVQHGFILRQVLKDPGRVRILLNGFC